MFNFTRKVILQSTWALIVRYPDRFTVNDFPEHIEDLIHLFLNIQLGDSVFRVGSDLKRKLGGDDRVVGAIELSRKHKFQFEKLIDVLVFRLLFRATDESGSMLKNDIDFIQNLNAVLDEVLTSVCGLDRQFDNELSVKIKKEYCKLKQCAIVNT